MKQIICQHSVCSNFAFQFILEKVFNIIKSWIPAIKNTISGKTMVTGKNFIQYNTCDTKTSLKSWSFVSWEKVSPRVWAIARANVSPVSGSYF